MVSSAGPIFAVNEMLEDHKDVLITKLIDGKVTFVHKTMWQQVYAMRHRARRLANGRSLYGEVDYCLRNSKRKKAWTQANGLIRGMKPGDVARDLELRILIHAEQLHTESGAHARGSSWDCWAKRVSFKFARGIEIGKTIFEKLVSQLNNKFGSGAKLP